jgi:hypothetical protein
MDRISCQGGIGVDFGNDGVKLGMNRSRQLSAHTTRRGV